MAEREPWAKPLPTPTLSDDPIAHLERRAPANRTAMQLVTVRLAGGDRDGEELLIPLRDVQHVLDRAVHYRAFQWPELGRPDLVAQDILSYIHESPLTMRMPGGWIEIGMVGDSWSGPDWLRVWWSELTDEVKIDHPQGWVRRTS